MAGRQPECTMGAPDLKKAYGGGILPLPFGNIGQLSKKRGKNKSYFCIIEGREIRKPREKTRK